MKPKSITVQVKTGNAVIREIELSIDDANYIMEALKFYANSSEKLRRELLDRNFIRLGEQAFYLRSDINDILDKLK